MKIFLIMMLMMFALYSEGQNNIASDSNIHYEFATVNCDTRAFNTTVKVYYQNGRSENLEEVMKIKFKNYQKDSLFHIDMMAVFQYMDKKGFELITSHVISYSTFEIFHYIYRKKIK